MSRGRILRRTAREFLDDQLLHWAAALTYYSLLSLFPALLLLVSILGLIGPAATQPLVDSVSVLAPGPARDVALGALERLQSSSGSSVTAVAIGSATALWAASGYVGAFIPASNAIWEVTEARPFLRRLRVRFTLTLILLGLIAATALVVGLTDSVARVAGSAIGVGETTVAIWSVARWPTLVILVTVSVAVLYRLAPNVDSAHRSWKSPGSLVAVLVWVGASAGFTFYVREFADYHRVYGAVTGVVILLVWLWITNVALLAGAELNAEIARARREAASGAPERPAEESAPPHGEAGTDGGSSPSP